MTQVIRQTAVFPVRIVQDLLIRKGFDVGPQGATGTWGTASAIALERAVGRPVPGDDTLIAGSHGQQLIQMPAGFFEFISNLPDPPNLWPWIIGGSIAVLGFVWLGYNQRQAIRDAIPARYGGSR